MDVGRLYSAYALELILLTQPVYETLEEDPICLSSF